VLAAPHPGRAPNNSRRWSIPLDVEPLPAALGDLPNAASSARELERLQADPQHVATAEREITRRLVAGTALHPTMIIVAQLLGAGGPEWMRAPGTILIIGLALLRVWPIWLVRRDQRPRLRRYLRDGTSLLIAALWGVIEAGHLVIYGATFEMLVITVLVCGIAMGIMTSVAPDRPLQITMLALLMAPVPIVELARGQLSAWLILHIAYFGYAAVQGGLLYRDYWNGIATSDRLARHAASLRQANAELKQLQQNLRFAERMSSLGTLAAGVAHEINNPMTYVVGNLDYIAEELQRRPRPAWGDAEPSLEQLLAEAQDGARRVVRIVRDLKTFSRHSEDDPLAPVELENVLDTAADMTRAQVRHRARLEREYRGATMVLGDNVRLGQVFVNLVVNAAQAIPDGEGQERHVIVLRTYVDEQGRAVAEVEDTGVGIKPEDLPRLFDPFFTTKPIGVGTGLGLSSAMGIVSALGGTIDVDSKPGAGTIVRVRLPHLTSERSLRKAG
jgi:signal transduction histidine kinase